ncbi:AraC family transcriptional regulator [Pseudomonas sp. 2(2015)]|uniref:helix-turn-helix transcriptional regulator n=1 Tax=Pseudomonas sp. 2(2015) TaxID=1619950 RepID=UPI0005EBDF7A|nr:AraC family transcriptional regulator [Pseudomonas sp. 2(2015)]KJK20274.1 AraC family transcriptional regulator [Pseudomonas sp. 2(2015)]
MAATQDFVTFTRIPEGGAELLSARFSKQAFGRHCHDRYALGVISGGAERMYYRGSNHLAGAGSVVTISPGEIHDGLPGHEQGWMYRMLYLDPQWLNQTLFGHKGHEHIHLFTSAFEHLPPLACTFLHHHQALEQSPCSLERESLLLGLLSQVFERSGALIPAVIGREREAVQRVRSKLEADFDQQLSLEHLASLVGLEPLYLIRVFKNSVGISPHSYQIQLRIAQVQRLLRAGASIADASFTCGFFDQSHMTRAFKKVVGVTPGSFRA